MFKLHYWFKDQCRVIFISLCATVFAVNIATGQTTSLQMPTVTSAGASSAYTLASGETINFYDDGNLGANYTDGALASNASGTASYIFTPPSGTYLQIVFSSFALGTGTTPGAASDNLKIYAGTTAGTLLGTYTGTTSPGTQTAITDCNTGKLTFVLTDYNTASNSTDVGWAATITVVSPSTAIWAGTSSTTWGVAGNWSPSGIPGCYTNVTIPAAPTNQPRITATGLICRDLTLNASSTLTLAYSTSSTTVFHVYGAIDNTGTITQTTTNKGYLQADGALTNNSGGLLTVGKGNVTVSGAVTNNGRINTLSSASTGTLTVTGTTTNSNTITDSTGATTLDFTGDFINTGTLKFTGGSATVNMRGNVTNNGTINQTVSSRIQLWGATKTIAGTGTFSNSKFQVLTGGSYALQNSMSIGSNILNELQIDAGGSFDLNNYILQISTTITQNGTLDFGATGAGTGELRYSGTSATIFTNSTFNERSGLVYYNSTNISTGQQLLPGTTAPGFTYYDVKINNNGTALTGIGGGGPVICNNLTLTQGASSATTGGTYMFDSLTVNNNLTIGSGCQLFVNIPTGTASSSTDYTLNVGGDFTNNGTFIPNDKGYTVISTTLRNALAFPNPATLNFIGSGNTQTLGGTTQTTFYNLTLRKSGNGTVQLGNKITVKNTLVLGNDHLLLNTHPITINRAATAAIAKTVNSSTDFGCMVSEDASLDGSGKAINAARVKWFVGTNTGAYVFPFGSSSNDYIPFIFNVNTGAQFDTVSIGTYRTASDITPLPIPVANINDNTPGYSYNTNGYYQGINNATHLVQRFWQIDPTITTGMADITFTYAQSEIPSNTSGLSTAETNLHAQRWNATTQQWSQQAAVNMGTQSNDESGNTVTVMGQGVFSPWAISQDVKPLPIELLGFTATLSNRVVLLKWATATEFQSKQFVVERSKDGKTFIPITTVAGNGTTGDMHQYSIVDNVPLAGLSYYRLLQIDNNGNYGYSHTVAIETKTTAVTIYWDKANAAIVLNCVGIETETSYCLTVFDCTGNHTATTTGTLLIGGNTIVVNNLHLAEGVYLARLVYGDEEVQMKVLVGY